MYIRWVNYTCPACGKEWTSRVLTAPRVGREFRQCRRCHYKYRTPDKEWRNMTRGQRTEYLLSIWIVCWIVLFTLGGVANPDWPNKWVGAFLGLAIGIGCALPFWLWKLWQIRLSIIRTDGMNRTGNADGSLLWVRPPAKE